MHGSRSEIRLDPHVQPPIMLLGRADDDRPKLALISRAKERSVEGNGSRQLRDVVTIDGAVACQFRQCQVVWVKRAESKALHEEMKQKMGAARQNKM